eukprot:9740824-Alexandrium_andersonii.AAC.1
MKAAEASWSSSDWNGGLAGWMLRLFQNAGPSSRKRTRQTVQLSLEPRWRQWRKNAGRGSSCSSWPASRRAKA